MKLIKLIFGLCAILCCTVQISCSDASAESDMSLWQEDFKFQPIASRPQLEVCFTDSSRTAFEILAQDYDLVGQLSAPHLLTNKEDGSPWLWFEMEDQNGTQYSTKNYKGKTRINLYRRGPYYCEIHWFDLHMATEKGDTVGMKGDLTLYCYPEKILADIRWLGTSKVDPKTINIKGIVDLAFAELKPFDKGVIQNFSFPMFGEQEPLPDEAFQLLEGADPVRYDKKRGCYILGTHTSGDFTTEFYVTPNRYETAKFSVSNNDKKRKIYICHESSVGGCIVEGGMVLDSIGHPMPIVVQVSKNFAGEKEEKYYNPTDHPFSETIFPLYLEPNEEHTLSTLHLYQNWGNHMTKHWSSLGAWMDYFHSSTGVTETTCYVPFKYAGLGGVAIADFRAMSQDCFWSGQPQHDNLAGHSFLSYFDGNKWVHSVYTGTTYSSTGPNWYDIGLNYLTADGKIKETIRIFEAPQSDELRSYFNARYEILQPMTIEDAAANFRMLNVTSRIQDLRFNRFAATGIEEIALTQDKKPFPVKGMAMPDNNFYMAVYGDSVQNRGSNAIIIKSFTAPAGVKPAVSVQLGTYNNVFKMDRDVDTRLMLVAQGDKLTLNAGDVIEIEGYWLPYGATFDTKSAQMVTKFDAEKAPNVVNIKKGQIVSHLPVTVKAKDNQAEFTISGGKNLTPVLITGLTKWRFPRIYVEEEGVWRPLLHSRNSDLDGYQVYCDEEGGFTSVFLVPSSDKEQHIKVEVGKEIAMPTKMTVELTSKDDQIQVSSPNSQFTTLISPPTMSGAPNAEQILTWNSSEGGSLWFTQELGDWKRGGRLSPNYDDIDLEYWWQNKIKTYNHTAPRMMLDLAENQLYEASTLFALVDGEWTPMQQGQSLPNNTKVQAIAAVAQDGKHIVAIAYRNSCGAVSEGTRIGLDLIPMDSPTHKRYHVRGKIYNVESSMDILKERIIKDLY